MNLNTVKGVTSTVPELHPEILVVPISSESLVCVVADYKKATDKFQ